MKKRIISVLLILSLVISLLPITTLAAEITASGTCGENLTWTLDADGTLTISGTGEMHEYHMYSDCPWYPYRDSILKVEIQDGVTTIGCYAFFESVNLQSVDLPDSLTSIGHNAFSMCTDLTYIRIPDGVDSIGWQAFSSCANLQVISFPASVTYIDSNVLYGCESLWHVLYEGTEAQWSEVLIEASNDYLLNATIHYSAASDATVPASGATCTEEAVLECTICGEVLYVALENENHIWVDADCETSTTCSVCGATDGAPLGHLYEAGVCIRCEKELSGVCGENLTWKITRNGTLIISGTGDMYDYEDNNPNGAPWYPYYENILTIIVEEGVTGIGTCAFYYCQNAIHAVLPESVTRIGEKAFSDCTSLESVNIPAGITVIERSVFSWCYKLKELELPAGVTRIGSSAFSYCESLESINIPASVTEIEGGVFNSCRSLKKLELPEGITSIARGTFGSCVSLESINIPDSVASIGIQAFSHCESLKQLEMPDTVTEIGYGAFSACSSLESINIPNGITFIENYAYSQCSSLKQIEIPASITKIDYYAFENCFALETIIFTGDAPSISPGVFSGVTATAYYPADNATWTDEVMQNYDGNITWVISSPCVKGHSYDDGVITAEPTCTATGTKTFTCTVCGATNTEVISALTCSFTEYYSNNDATCIADGTMTATCDHGCGATNTVIDSGSLNPNAHAFGEWTVDGSKETRICTLCGHTESKITTQGGDVEIQAPEQPGTDFEVEPVEPADEQYILVEEAVNNNHEADCEVLKVFDITLKNEDGVHVQPNGTVKVKLPLDWEKEGNYKVYRVNDDGTLTDMNAYQQGSHMVFETDHFSLYIIVEESVHTHNLTLTKAAEPTCSKDGNKAYYTCSDCESWFEDAAGTVEIQDKTSVVIPSLGHDWKEATCEDPKTCARCGATDGDALGHTYQDGVCGSCGSADPDYEKPEEPTVPSEPSTPSKPNWGNIFDKWFGGWWGNQEACDHTYTSVVTAPTCTEKGYTTHTCTKCGETYKDSYTSALGHDWDDGTVTKASTCTKDGVKTYTCETCGNRKEETIKSIGHQYTNGVCTECGAKESGTSKPNKPWYKNLFDWIWNIF